MCHFLVSPHCCWGDFFNIGLCMAFNLSCLRFATLPWAPVPLLLLLARSKSVSWVPVRPPIAADFIARLCHVPLFRSPYNCWWVPFCDRVLLWPSIAAASTATPAPCAS
ncbi:unnamed protein product, partial [Staurois parvus]